MAERPERRRQNLGGQNWLGVPDGRTTARTAAVAEMGAFGGLSAGVGDGVEMGALMGSDGIRLLQRGDYSK
jgi:hypothetical protein